MQEGTNKAIVINTLILYIKLIVTAVCGLLSSRFALQALGVNDYGIFSVVGSVIAIIAILNTIMVSTSNRFLAVEIGKGDDNNINRQFNINLLIHVVIAILIAVLAIPLGDWYIFNYVNYDGDISLVVKVYNITIWGSVISFIGVPYNGLLMAKERFLVFSLVSIIESLAKVVVCYLLIYYFTNKLLVYTITNTILTAAPTVVFIIYCSFAFGNYVKLRIVRGINNYKPILSFSVWVGYGAIAWVGKAQGAALIVNMFFNTAMNAALGLANTINNLISNFSTNAAKSIAPQITKYYASGNVDKALSLVCLSSKVSFLFMLFISSPFFVSSTYLFQLWLGTVPDYVELFTILLIVDALVGSFNSGISELVFAKGEIKWYQLVVNTLFLLSVVAGFFVLRAGAPAYALLVTYIVFSIITLFVRQIVLNRVVKVDNWRIIKESYFPSLLVLLCYVPFVLFHPSINPLVLNAISLSYLSLLVAYVGLNKRERKYMTDNFLKKIKLVPIKNEKRQ